MTFFLFGLLAIIISCTSTFPKNKFNWEGYLSIEQTRCISGIFVILVLFSHYKNDYFLPGKYDEIYMAFQNHLGQNIVTMFLFYSGFGMMSQVDKKGLAYVWKIPKKFITLLCKFALAVLLFLILQRFYGQSYSGKRILLSFIGWSSIGNSNWYIFVILCVYLCFFLSFFLSHFLLRKNWENIGVLFLSLLCILLLVFLRENGKEPWWYNTIIAFLAGALYSRVKGVPRVLKGDTEYYILLSVLISAYVVALLKKGEHFFWYEVWVVLFAVLIVMASAKISISSPFLDFLGSHVFSVYILQRIPMIILKRAGFLAAHPYIGLTLVLCTTIIMAVLFDWLTKKCIGGFINRVRIYTDYVMKHRAKFVPRSKK